MFGIHQSIEFVRSLRAEHWILLAGVISLGYWLLRTSLGVKALADSMPRRNSMPPYLPLIPLFIWFGPVPLAVLIVRQALTQSSPMGLTGLKGEGFAAFLDNCLFIGGGIVTTVVILFLARAHFARRLKGFGLNIKSAPADLLGAIANLLAVWPLVLATIAATVFVGRYIWGQDYQMQKHQELQLLAEYPQLPLQIAVVVAAAVIAPILEELLFRGLVQTFVRSLLETRTHTGANTDIRGQIGASSYSRPHRAVWLAIAVSSALFALMHANQEHWPALFILGAGLGYSYEKSGSLFRPIFMHAFFNIAMIAMAVSQS